MAISRCNKCGTIAEHERSFVGSNLDCAQCGTATLVYDTLFFVNKLSQMFFSQRKELNELRNAAPAPQSETKTTHSNNSFNIHNSDSLSTEAQHEPIIKWFSSKNISATVNVKSVDTTGFFDEAAVAIGKDYALLGAIFEQIRYAQQKDYNSITVQLDKKSKEQAKLLKAFIQQLYEHSLFSRIIHHKNDGSLRVILQNAPSVRQFFAGGWLEWFALMVCLRLCKAREVKFSCARNMTLSFLTDEKRELDVFLLINDTQPIYIECKSGDFRQDLEKYVLLSKRLGISQKYFIICVADLETEQCKGLGAMYGLTFVNTQTLEQHLLTLF